MKKIGLFFAFIMVATFGFSQITKADAAGFLTRNPISKCKRIFIESMPDPVGMERDALVSWKAEDIVSLTALDSGFSLIIRYDDWNKEKFFPYDSIRSIFISGDNTFVISIRR